MSAIFYNTPQGWPQTMDWILLPAKFQPIRPEAERVQAVVSPKLDMIGNCWKALPRWAEWGIPTVVVLVFVGSSFLINIPLMIISGGMLLACGFGKNPI